MDGCQTEGRRSPGKIVQNRARHFGAMRDAPQCHLVQPVFTTDDDSMPDVEPLECLSQQRTQLRLADAQQLKTSLGGIAERSQQIEDRAETQLARTCATCFIEGWCNGAKQKQIPTVSRHFSACSIDAWMFTPNSAKTSAEPVLLLAAAVAVFGDGHAGGRRHAARPRC